MPSFMVKYFECLNNQSVVLVPAVSSTCQEIGRTATIVCEGCGIVVSEPELEPKKHTYIEGECTVCGKKEHKYEEGVCTFCGQEEATPDSYFQVTLLDDGTYCIDNNTNINSRTIQNTLQLTCTVEYYAVIKNTGVPLHILT